ncbi:unnamed protein product [Meloidogyne enterolobii]|uniref:Uncharacterized protein n=1 Tax=Meloidogyne enterolobii TaxID=390850 RepID=A0ACB0XTK7_MELEN
MTPKSALYDDSEQNYNKFNPVEKLCYYSGYRTSDKNVFSEIRMYSHEFYSLY